MTLANPGEVRPGLLLLVMTAACARGGANEPPDGTGGTDAPGDGTGMPIDAPATAIDAPPGGGPVALLLTEVVLAPAGAEYIELANPTAQTVALDNYYLSDHGAYFRVPTGAPAVDATDFIVKFPAGATIGPKAAITVAIDTAVIYQTSYGIPPTFSIASGTMTAVSTNGVASLTNTGELVALFYWNGQDDLVRDVDLVLVGLASGANGLIDKSGVALDGPDADTTSTAYAADARTIAAQPSAPGSARSTKRIMLEAGHEIQSGTGNGLTGDDETSENTGSTWDIAFTPPTPGALPPGLIP